MAACSEGGSLPPQPASRLGPGQIPIVQEEEEETPLSLYGTWQVPTPKPEERLAARRPVLPFSFLRQPLPRPPHGKRLLDGGRVGPVSLGPQDRVHARLCLAASGTDGQSRCPGGCLGDGAPVPVLAGSPAALSAQNLPPPHKEKGGHPACSGVGYGAPAPSI